MKEVSSLTELCDEGMLSVAEKVKLDFYIAKYSKVLKLFFLCITFHAIHFATKHWLRLPICFSPCELLYGLCNCADLDHIYLNWQLFPLSHPHLLLCSYMPRLR